MSSSYLSLNTPGLPHVAKIQEVKAEILALERETEGLLKRLVNFGETN